MLIEQLALHDRRLEAHRVRAEFDTRYPALLSLTESKKEAVGCELARLVDEMVVLY